MARGVSKVKAAKTSSTSRVKKERHTRKRPKPPKIPSKVNILGHEWDVVWVDYQPDGSENRGECEWPKREIRLRKVILSDKELSWLFFLHELKHAFDFESGLGEVLQRQAQEIGCEQFASFITSLQKQGVL